MKKCIICEGEAVYMIKDSSEAYCESCAKDNFSDVSFLVAIDEAKRLKKKLAVEEKNNL